MAVAKREVRLVEALHPKYRVCQITFFLKIDLKKLLNIFSYFFSYLKVQSFRLIMKFNFIPMAASDGHAAAYLRLDLSFV